MYKIMVLGCGLMGPTIARDCAESESVSKVLARDIDEEKLRNAKEFVSSPKLKTARLNIADHDALVKKMRGFDVVVNATAARFSMGVLEAAMEAGVDVVDLSGGSYPLDGELYGRVEEAGITAIPGCGVDPGLIDILSGYGIDLMDEVDGVYFACGGLPMDPKPPLDYKIVFGGRRMPIRPGKVPVILDGERVQVDRYDDLEPVFIEGLKDMEAFYDGFPSSLLKLCEEREVKTFKGKTIRYVGFVDKLIFLLDLGVIGSEPVTYEEREIVPLDFFQELVYPVVRFDEAEGDRDITVLLVRVEGQKSGSEMIVTYEMVDYYDEEKGITSMAKTTGYTASIIARILARGDIPEKGIQWPVRIIKGELFEELMSSLKERGVEVTENILKTTEL
ncbi:MAG: saccharopine dehydrogenase NADP-binding domain-containing protein [Candidatus Bathyarchaeota archaeon]|nr:MAG: saccharopine dehydrogenase NADP-binding domain-containing protein [Candidatus Bathyarchaeota archaeon]